MTENNTSNIDSGFFRALISYYCHQNQLMWNRVHTFVIVQLAVIGGSYSIRNDTNLWLILLLLSGALITFLLLILFDRDCHIRDANRDLINDIGKELSKKYTNEENKFFKLTLPPKSSFHPTASGLFKTIAYFTIFIEMSIFLYLVFFFVKHLLCK